MSADIEVHEAPPEAIEGVVIDPEEAASVGPIYVARVALAAIRLPDDAESMHTGPDATALSAKVEQKFREALTNDPRVSQVEPANEPFDVDNARTFTFYEFDDEEDDLRASMRTYEAFALNSVLYFKVRVPRKNQPKYRSMDDVPADEYLVAWNGLALVVQWDQEVARATGSGGHVVLEILEEAGTTAGYSVEVIACAPGCRHRFVHADFVTFDADPPDHFHVAGQTPVGSTAITPYVRESTEAENIRRTLASVLPAVHRFAEAKSRSDLILYLANRARMDSASVLSLSYQWASRTRLPRLLGWVRDLWDLRSSRRETTSLVAGIWLALSMIDARIGTFLRYEEDFVDVLSKNGMSELEDYLETDAKGIREMNLSGVRASLQETSSRQEGRLLVAATFAGALAAMAGAALAALLT